MNHKIHKLKPFWQKSTIASFGVTATSHVRSDLAKRQKGTPTSYIYYFDNNSLYPSVMAVFPLPAFGIRWMSQFEIQRFDVMSVSSDSNSGYILICDIKYPDELHDLHYANLMCPESQLIGQEDISQYTCDLAASCNITMVNVNAPVVATTSWWLHFTAPVVA